MKRNKKGFTLAELLIVVAIIAVLVGISIPVFTAKLESSREATDLANLRAAYALATTDLLTGEYTSGAAIYDVTIKQTTPGWTGDNANAVIGGTSVNTDPLNTADENDVVNVKVNSSGVASFTVTAH